MRRGVVTGAFLGLLSWSSLVRAETLREVEAPSQSDRPNARRAASGEGTHWYGWQTLLVDGASLAVIVGGFAVRPPHSDWSVVSVAGVGAWAVGAPVVHWAHARVGVGFASLGLRLALPTLGGYLASRPCSSGECSAQVLGATLGVALIPAPMVIDAVWLARERREPIALRGAPRKLALVPIVVAAGRRGFLGVAGSF